MSDRVFLNVEKKGARRRIGAVRIHFSVHRCFERATETEQQACLERIGETLLETPGLALYGPGPLLEPLLECVPRLREHVLAFIEEGPQQSDRPVLAPGQLPAEIQNVFLCQTQTFERLRRRQKLATSSARVIDAEILRDVAPEVIPGAAWTPLEKHIYPIEIPEIELQSGLDLVLLDCPASNLALMPNGLGYVHNALKKTSARFQTFDIDIVAYHRFHLHRILDEGGRVVLPSGRELPQDPWQAEHYDLWNDDEVISHFAPLLQESVAAIVAARPKILALSVQQCNEVFTRHLVTRVQQALPEIIVLVGGFSCYNADIGRRAFPLADYMCIGESDLSVGPLVEALIAGEKPRNLPGVLSRFDDATFKYIPAPVYHDLDRIESPHYEWFGIDIYRNYNGYQLTPIIASRGCRWSRCTFCAERFYWRIRSAAHFVDELAWLVDQGCTLFMFNESDLNGNPDLLLEICDEIVRRDLNVKLTGQLRIHKRSDRDFFDRLHKAGFVALRFGVDACSENTLRLQKKGYTLAMAAQNMKDCWEAGIFTEINWVIGVPGETDADTEEGVQFILQNRQYIGRLANINPLILVNGSVYWIDPDAHNIRFRKPKEELYQQFPRAIPADQWYSEEPYIDAQIRKERFERIVLGLHDAGFPVGAWAERVIADVRESRDRNRAGANPAPKPEPTKTASDPIEPGKLEIPGLDSHQIFEDQGWFFAVPNGLTIDSFDPVSLPPGVARARSLEGLRSVLESASEWANARGHYDPRASMRSGLYLRAGSALGETPRSTLTDGCKLIRFEHEWFAVKHDALAGPGLPDMDRPRPAPTTPLRKLANRLPAPIYKHLRAALDRQIGARAARGRSELAVVGAVCRGLIEHATEQVAYGVRSLFGARGDTDVHIIAAVSADAVPQLLRGIGRYNLVSYDGAYYGVPQGLPVCFEDGDGQTLPEVLRGHTVLETTQAIYRELGLTRSATTDSTPQTQGVSAHGELHALPLLLGSLEGYDVIGYEGWVYGVPKSLGAIDLTEVDVMEMPGVIRDVSRDVVEGEILERSRSLPLL